MSADIFPVPADILCDVHERLSRNTQAAQRLAQVLIWRIDAKRGRITRNRKDNKEGEMSHLLGQGHYFVKITNDQRKPTLHREPEGPALDDARFLAVAGVLSTFSFEILNLDAPPIVHFAPTPVTWSNEPASGLQPPEVVGVTLTLKIAPGMITIDQEFHFDLCFDNGAMLWSADGLRPLDPTIIEKPPE